MADGVPIPTATSIGDITNVLNRNGTAKTEELEGVSLEAFLSSLSASAVAFGVQLIIFAVLRRKLHRIYEVSC